MAEVKQVKITLPSRKEVSGNIVTSFQHDNMNFLISHLNDPSVPQPEGMVNLSVSLLEGSEVKGIEKNDIATWDPLRDDMRGIITGISYPTNYNNNVPDILSATSESYARHIAVTSDQKEILQNDYISKIAAKEVVAPEPVQEIPSQESPAAQDVAFIAPGQTLEASSTVAPAVSEPVVTPSVFDSAPVVESPVVETPQVVEQQVMSAPEITENPTVTESATNIDVASMKENFMNAVSALFDQTFADLTNSQTKISQMEQELNQKIADANNMLAAAEEAKKDAEAKAAVATVAFNNAQSLNQTPVATETVIQMPTSEGPVLAKQ